MDWEHEIRSDLSEWDEDERSLVESWMRDLESRLIDDVVGVDNQVKIKGSWSPPLFFGTITPVLRFDGQQRIKQSARVQGGLDVDDAVEVRVLIDVTDRVGLDDGRFVDEVDVNMLRDGVDRAVEYRFSISKIGTNRDVGVMCHTQV